MEYEQMSLESTRRWQKENHEKVLEYTRKFNRLHRERRNAERRARYLRKVGQLVQQRHATPSKEEKRQAIIEKHGIGKNDR